MFLIGVFFIRLVLFEYFNILRRFLIMVGIFMVFLLLRYKVFGLLMLLMVLEMKENCLLFWIVFLFLSKL